jgi:hypothetical protein
MPGLLFAFGIAGEPLTVYSAVGWYASLTKPDAYVVAEIGCIQNLTSSTRF